MNIETRIPTLKTLKFNNLIRRGKGYTIFKFTVLIIQAWIIFLTYTDTSLIFATKVILIIIEVQLAIMIMTSFEDLNFFQSLKLVYSFIMSPKIYQTTTNNDLSKTLTNQIIIDFSDEIEQVNPDRKVINSEKLNKIKRIGETSKAKIDIKEERFEEEVKNKAIKEELKKEEVKESIDLLSMIKIDENIEKESEKKKVMNIEAIDFEEGKKEVEETIREEKIIKKIRKL